MRSKLHSLAIGRSVSNTSESKSFDSMTHGPAMRVNDVFMVDYKYASNSISLSSITSRPFDPFGPPTIPADSNSSIILAALA